MRLWALIIALVVLLVALGGCATLKTSSDQPFKLVLVDQNNVTYTACTPTEWGLPSELVFDEVRDGVIRGLYVRIHEWKDATGFRYLALFTDAATPRILGFEVGYQQNWNQGLPGLIESTRKWCVFDKFDGQNPRIVDKVGFNLFIKTFLGLQPVNGAKTQKHTV